MEKKLIINKEDGVTIARFPAGKQPPSSIFVIQASWLSSGWQNVHAYDLPEDAIKACKELQAQHKYVDYMIEEVAMSH